MIVLAIMAYAMPLLTGRALFDSPVATWAFWTCNIGMSAMTGAFAVAGISQVYLERKVGMDFLEVQNVAAANLAAAPAVASHDADLPRVAIYSQWGQTQELGWYRFTFDKFGIPFDLIYKELLDLKEDGSFRMDMGCFNYCQGGTMTNRRFEQLFGGPPRRPGRTRGPWRPGSRRCTGPTI